MAAIHDFQETPAHVSEINLHITSERVAYIEAQLSLTTVEDKHGYVHLTISHSPSGSKFQALHTKSVRNIEKVHHNVGDMNILAAIVLKFQSYIKSHGIEYCEVFLPASNLWETEFWLQEGFQLAGYIPAWLPCTDETGCFEDAVVFSWHLPECDATQPRLIDEAKDLASTLAMVNNYTPDHYRLSFKENFQDVSVKH